MGAYMRILGVLADGPKTSNQVMMAIDKSREHTSRLMNSLFKKGFVVRNDLNKPYVYVLTDAGRAYLRGEWASGT